MLEATRDRSIASDITARIDVRCPDGEASRHFGRYIDDHFIAADVVCIALRLRASLFKTRPTPLERQVYATLSARHSTSVMQQTYAVTLVHGSSCTTPYFSGVLAIHTSSANDRIGLVIAGRAEPQAGTLGTLFDRTSGQQVARTSASVLLRTIGTYVEVASARNEAARAGKRRYQSWSIEAGAGTQPTAMLRYQGSDATLAS